jgi:hypothetical protein
VRPIAAFAAIVVIQTLHLPPFLSKRASRASKGKRRVRTTARAAPCCFPCWRAPAEPCCAALLLFSSRASCAAAMIVLSHRRPLSRDGEISLVLSARCRTLRPSSSRTFFVSSIRPRRARAANRRARRSRAPPPPSRAILASSSTDLPSRRVVATKGIRLCFGALLRAPRPLSSRTSLRVVDPRACAVRAPQIDAPAKPCAAAAVASCQLATCDDRLPSPHEVSPSVRLRSSRLITPRFSLQRMGLITPQTLTSTSVPPCTFLSTRPAYAVRRRCCHEPAASSASCCDDLVVPSCDLVATTGTSFVRAFPRAAAPWSRAS